MVPCNTSTSRLYYEKTGTDVNIFETTFVMKTKKCIYKHQILFNYFYVDTGANSFILQKFKIPNQTDLYNRQKQICNSLWTCFQTQFDIFFCNSFDQLYNLRILGLWSRLSYIYKGHRNPSGNVSHEKRCECEHLLSSFIVHYSRTAQSTLFIFLIHTNCKWCQADHTTVAFCHLHFLYRSMSQIRWIQNVSFERPHLPQVAIRTILYKCTKIHILFKLT